MRPRGPVRSTANEESATQVSWSRKILDRRIGLRESFNGGIRAAKRSSLSAPERPGTSAPGDWPQFRDLTPGNAPRSTKARRGRPATSGVVFPEGGGMDPLNEAGRLTPATEIADAARAGGVDCAQRRPEITPCYEPNERNWRSSPRTTLNEGRRLPPGYERGNIRTIGEGTNAQRRPEVTPGYDLNIQAHDVMDTVDAQRRPEITPGYDAECRRSISRRNSARSTKAGDYPRLRRLARLAEAADTDRAQRRPEITPGYDTAATGGAPPR